MRSSSRSTRARPRSSGSSSREKSSFLETEPAYPAARLADLSVRVAELPRERRRRRARVRLLWQWTLFVGGLVVLSGAVLGLAFAGSAAKLPSGAHIAGVDVAGLTSGDARAMLERRARGLGTVP